MAIVINECIATVEIEAWLGGLPQLFARIHIKELSIRSVLHPLLTQLDEKQPRALMYPLSVLLKSPVAERKSAAESLMTSMTSLKAHSSELVKEALMVSLELICVAILWVETWRVKASKTLRASTLGKATQATLLKCLTFCCHCTRLLREAQKPDVKAISSRALGKI